MHDLRWKFRQVSPSLLVAKFTNSHVFFSPQRLSPPVLAEAICSRRGPKTSKCRKISLRLNRIYEN